MMMIKLLCHYVRWRNIFAFLVTQIFKLDFFLSYREVAGFNTNSTLLSHESNDPRYISKVCIESCIERLHSCTHLDWKHKPYSTLKVLLSSWEVCTWVWPYGYLRFYFFYFAVIFHQKKLTYRLNLYQAFHNANELLAHFLMSENEILTRFDFRINFQKSFLLRYPMEECKAELYSNFCKNSTNSAKIQLYFFSMKSWKTCH